MRLTRRKPALALSVVSLAAALLMSGCSSSGKGAASTASGATTKSAAAASGPPIQVGAVVDLTGYVAGSDKPYIYGAQLYFKQVNSAGGVLGRQINLIVEDSGSVPTKAVTATQKLLSEDSVVAFLDGSVSASAPANEPVLAAAKVPALLGAVVPAGSKYQVTLFPPVGFGINLRLQWAQSKGITKIGVLRDSTPFSTLQYPLVQSQAAKLGMTIVGTESADSSAVDLRTQINKLTGAGAQAIVKLSFGATTIAAGKALAEAGSKVPLLGYDTAATGLATGKVYPNFYEPLQAPAVYSALSTSQRWPTLNTFMTALGSSDEDPQQAALGYDSASLLVQAIKKAGSATGPDIRAALTALGTVPGAYSPTYDFSTGSNGVTTNPSFLVQPLPAGGFTIAATPSGK